jgi:HAD superfamily hydrolase (TIGR01549 family)
MSAVKVVAFDCDGVLFDTAESNQAYYNVILNHFDRPAMTPEQFRFVHSHTVEQSLSFLLGDEGVGEELNAFRKTLDYGQFIKCMRMEPYLKTVLAEIQMNLNCKTAVATNRTDSMHRLLAEFGLSNDFDLVVTASDVKRPKPHPDELLKILDHFKLSPRELLYVGDSQLDEQAARSADVPLVAYRNRDLAADYHIESLKELPAILDGAPVASP